MLIYIYIYIIEFPFYIEKRQSQTGRERQREQARRRSLERGMPPRFVIAGIYKQYPPSMRRRGFPKRNMVIRAMAHIDMNDARH